MAILGYGSGGGSGLGPSRMFSSLPWKGWREVANWVEEFVDACGYRFDVLNSRFISTQARANLLDPTIAPSTSNPPTNYFATATAPAIQSATSATMLDVLLFIALGIYPLDSNLSVAQKQSLAQIGWDALKRKGTRLRLLELASPVLRTIATGWTVPPNNFSIIVGDGLPSPGAGDWVQASSTTQAAVRPWVLSAVRSTLGTITPAYGNLGVGFSQFRAGYSSAGETVFPTGCTTNILAHEHFDAWVGSVPTGWTKTGTGTLTQSTSAASINWEFTGSAAVLNLIGASAGVSVGLSQTAGHINNQYTHHFQLDYAYTNAQNVSTLTAQITDINGDGVTYYWNPTTSTWSSTPYTIAIPPSATRARYACNITPQSASATASTQGTSSIKVAVSATSDGTATYQTTYTLYRAGLYESFSLAIESAATGERTAWYPLYDAQGWTNAARATSNGFMLEMANASRSAYKVVPQTAACFPYHPALSGRGFQGFAGWNNLVSSYAFDAPWALTNCLRAFSAVISPVVGETSATATRFTAQSTGAFTSQSLGVTPTSRTYVGGVWIKKLSADNSFTDVTLSLISTSTVSQTFTLTQAQGWQLLPIKAAFGPGDVATLSFKIAWGAGVSNGQIAAMDPYLYDVTNNPNVLYPPVERAYATGLSGATSCRAITQTQNSNVLHPLTQRTLTSIIRGAATFTIAPAFDASSQPNGVLLDVAQSATQNRVVIRVNGGTLQLMRWDNSGNTWQTALTMTTSATPTTGQVTWLRDTAITIRALWDGNSTMLSAGAANASGTKPGSWFPSDALVGAIGILNDYAGSNAFDGIIRGVEFVQLGAPAS